MFRRNRGQESDESTNRPQQVHHTSEKQVSVKITTRSLRSRRALEKPEEAIAINVESENSVMSGGEVNNLDL